MKLTVYGNNATCPAEDGACSCYMLEAEGKKIVIDMGNGCLAKLQQQIDLSEIDFIIISHLHFDHFGDLFCAKYQLETRKAYGERIDRIPLFAPALPAWASEELTANNIFDIHTISDGMNLVFPDCHIEVSFVEVVHLIESYGMRFTCNGKIFAYSGDSGWCPQLQKIAEKADLFLCEATYNSDMQFEEAHHLSARSAAAISLKAGARLLVLTHFQPSDKAIALNKAKDIFTNVTVSEIFKNFEV